MSNVPHVAMGEVETRAEDEVILLGHRYHMVHQADAFAHHIQSTFRFTYRRDFPALQPYPITSDSGWGCMLRAAQSLLAHTLSRHHLGTDWRFPCSATNPLDILQQSQEYWSLVTWFMDKPGAPHYYSLHHMLQSAARRNHLPGEWHAPSSAALVLRDLTAAHCAAYGGDVHTIVLSGDTIYISEIEQSCADEWAVDTLQEMLSTVQSAASSVTVKQTTSHRTLTLQEMRKLWVTNEKHLKHKGPSLSPSPSTSVSSPSQPKIDPLRSLLHSVIHRNTPSALHTHIYHQQQQEQHSSQVHDNNARVLVESLEERQRNHSLSLTSLCDEVYAQDPSSLLHSQQPTMLSSAVDSCDHSHDLSSSGTSEPRLQLSSITFYDPLHCVPPKAQRPWKHALLLLIPLRLGIQHVNEEYVDELAACLADPACVGILGGRPNRATYLVAYQSTQRLFLGHDPHETLPAKMEIDESLLKELHCRTLTPLPFSSLDPSLTLGFYFRRREDFQAFCQSWERRDRQRLEERQRQKRASVNNHAPRSVSMSESLFHVEPTPPQHLDLLDHDSDGHDDRDNSDNDNERTGEGVDEDKKKAAPEAAAAPASRETSGRRNSSSLLKASSSRAVNSAEEDDDYVII